MKKGAFFLLLAFTFISCKTYQLPKGNKEVIGQTLNDWHKAAAEANFEAYFAPIAEDGIYIGTDATENWSKEAFKGFAKPYFEKGKAWNFTAIERNIFLSDDEKTAWFDELLDTQMKICRGSGVLRKEHGQWKIVHYVLSMAVPNDNADEVVKIKTPFDDRLIKELKLKK